MRGLSPYRNLYADTDYPSTPFYTVTDDDCVARPRTQDGGMTSNRPIVLSTAF